MSKILGESYQYELLEYLGEGGSGRVYKAFRYSLAGQSHDVVALKFLKTEKSIQELMKEYSVVQKIKSKYVPTVYGIELIGKRPTLVMEYIDGITWARLFCQNLRETVKTYLMDELLTALDLLAKEVGFHGDISPHNIMIDRRGDLRLIDFGNHFLNNRFVYVTYEFLPEDVSRGEHNGVSTDLQAVEKLKKRYNIVIVEYKKCKTREELAVIVQKILLQHTLKISPRTNSSKQLVSLMVWSCLLLFFTPMQAHPPLQQQIQKPIVVSIVTSSWKEIWINGKAMGYTPIFSTIFAKQLFIEWKDGKKKGQFTKRALHHQISLGDKDFISD